MMFNHISFQGTNKTIEADDRCVDLDGSLYGSLIIVPAFINKTQDESH